MESNGDPFAGLDESEREILEREIREGRVPLMRVVVSDGVEPGTTEIRAEGAVVARIVGLDAADTRDLRDPMELGEKLLSDRAFRAEACQHMADGDPPLSRVYDYGARRGLL
jgi:hypothetical protein